MTKSIPRLRATPLLLLMVMVSGCTLPGLKPDVSGSDRTSTYNPPGRDSGVVLNYSPVVKKITPELIMELRRERAEQRDEMMSPRSAGESKPGYEPYRVGAGDILGVIVFGHPDITNPAGTSDSAESGARVVDAEGDIFMPFIGDMNVAGNTIDEIRAEIAEGLSDVLRDPQVDVKVLEYRSKQVYITGDMSAPCSIPIRDVPLTVVDALTTCPSLQAERDPALAGVYTIRLVRDGEEHLLELPLLSRKNGQPARLEDGDRLIVDKSFNRVFMVGEFNEQTAVPYAAGGMSLSDAMATAGGLNLDTVHAGGIYVIRGFVDADSSTDAGLQTSRRPRVYHFEADSLDAFILANQFKLKPRDVVYAAPASLVNFNRALAQIAPAVNLLFQSALIYDRGRRD